MTHELGFSPLCGSATLPSARPPDSSRRRSPRHSAAPHMRSARLQASYSPAFCPTPPSRAALGAAPVSCCSRKQRGVGCIREGRGPRDQCWQRHTACQAWAQPASGGQLAGGALGWPGRAALAWLPPLPVLEAGVPIGVPGKSCRPPAAPTALALSSCDGGWGGTGWGRAVVSWPVPRRAPSAAMSAVPGAAPDQAHTAPNCTALRPEAAAGKLPEPEGGPCSSSSSSGSNGSNPSSTISSEETSSTNSQLTTETSPTQPMSSSHSSPSPCCSSSPSLLTSPSPSRHLSQSPSQPPPPLLPPSHTTQLITTSSNQTDTP
ncbi:hypothetical protein V8C86DRAFT_3165719, partial [Haematococcus lacustris]